MGSDLELRVRRLEDRALISERVVTYALAIDHRDWELFGDCFTDPLTADYSKAGGWPAGTISRTEHAARVSEMIDGFTVTQYLSPNHIIEFDGSDPNRAVCYSYMFAQHLLEDSEYGDSYLLRGTYTNHMLRTPSGWQIERITLRGKWSDGNPGVFAEAVTRRKIEKDSDQ
ncbi:nuclear transport factor 2 family protein [Streptomyces chartreusis]|uniref:nuclear transport factor 2 family protein n=1 Tax=Streptomyces chartreusis TaxID=1969 RepID=UPI0036739951